MTVSAKSMSQEHIQFLEIIEKQLAVEPFSVGGVLQKYVVISKARDADEELLRLLLKNDVIKEKFFKKAAGALVFDRTSFVWYLEQKNYLNDSYTSYKNKVGLTIDGKYLRQRNEVALVWPFKDCYLEGGQSREEGKRDEIFFNEVLAQDEITQLLEEKVLTNAAVHDKDGKRNFKTFTRDAEINKNRNLSADTITDNLIIKGNNLLALHSLKKQFAGKVKLIYIDPPYNTGNDSFNYNDNFTHSTWLTFMKNRMEVARKLLRDDGVIFVQCDDNEQAYLKVLMDEVFGRDNCIGIIVAQTNPRGRSLDKYIAKTFEFINVFTKSMQSNSIYQVLKDERGLREYRLTDEKGKYREMRLMNGNRFFTRENRPNLWYPIYANPKTGRVSLEKNENFCIEIFPINSAGNEQCWTWSKRKFIEENNLLVARKTNTNNWRVYRKDYMMGSSLYTKQKSLWRDKSINHENGTEHVRSLQIEFSYPKSEDLLFKILEMSTKEGDIVMDYHLGSGTTATVAHKMGRQYIGIEQMDFIENIAVARLNKVIDGEQGGISKAIEWKGGGGFIYVELKKHNQKFMDDIQAADTPRKLSVVWNKMKERSFLDYNLDMKKQEEHLEEFKQLKLAEQKDLLCEILDKNQLYVNLTSLEDRDHACSAADKKLNTDFYQMGK